MYHGEDSSSSVEIQCDDPIKLFERFRAGELSGSDPIGHSGKVVHVPPRGLNDPDRLWAYISSAINTVDDHSDSGRVYSMEWCGDGQIQQMTTERGIKTMHTYWHHVPITAAIYLAQDKLRLVVYFDDTGSSIIEQFIIDKFTSNRP